METSGTPGRNADPDSFGTLGRYQKMPSTRFVARLAPGSRHWTSAFFFAYWFSFHSQVVLWIQSKYMRSFANLNRRRAKLDTLGSVAFWVALASIAGWRSLYVIVIPLIIANATVMSSSRRITSCAPRPRLTTQSNSMSVTTLKLFIDRVTSATTWSTTCPCMSAVPADAAFDPNAPTVRESAHRTRGVYPTPRYLDATNTVSGGSRPHGSYRRPAAAFTGRLGRD